MILQSKLKVGKIELKNRVVMAPMATEKSNKGKVSDELCQYYIDRTKDDKVGLVVLEHSFIDLQGRGSENQVSIADDSDIEGLSRLVEKIHANNTKVIAQINHVGSAGKVEILGEDMVGPSAVKNPVRKRKAIMPRELTKEEILEIEDKFIQAALRAKKAGFDGVELHSAHGYLLNQFYSPLTNKREDEYGGSLENRLRIHLEIIEKLRNLVGDDFILAIRLGSCDYEEGGITIEDSVKAAKILEKAGIDLLDISGSMKGSKNPYDKGAGYFKDITLAIKKEVNIPVILTGGIKTAAQAEIQLVIKACDLVGIGRAIFLDKDWAKNEVPSGEVPLIMYGTLNCPDCPPTIKFLEENGVNFVFKSMTEDLFVLKDFLKIREFRSEFDEIRNQGNIGVPCLINQDEILFEEDILKNIDKIKK